MERRAANESTGRGEGQEEVVQPAVPRAGNVLPVGTYLLGR